MNWSDIAMIIISVVLFQNMGLREAIEDVIHYKFRIFSCTRCSIFWIMIIYLLLQGLPIITVVSLSFISSYVGVWSELLFGILTYIYNVIYKRFCTFADE